MSHRGARDAIEGAAGRRSKQRPPQRRILTDEDYRRRHRGGRRPTAGKRRGAVTLITHVLENGGGARNRWPNEADLQRAGKPEPLRGMPLSGGGSRRLTQEQRLVYRSTDDGLLIAQCRLTTEGIARRLDAVASLADDVRHDSIRSPRSLSSSPSSRPRAPILPPASARSSPRPRARAFRKRRSAPPSMACNPI